MTQLEQRAKIELFDALLPGDVMVWETNPDLDRSAILVIERMRSNELRCLDLQNGRTRRLWLEQFVKL